jgi:hypothetical protein
VRDGELVEGTGVSCGSSFSRGTTHRRPLWVEVVCDSFLPFLGQARCWVIE